VKFVGITAAPSLGIGFVRLFVGVVAAVIAAFPLAQLLARPLLCLLGQALFHHRVDNIFSNAPRVVSWKRRVSPTPL